MSKKRITLLLAGYFLVLLLSACNQAGLPSGPSPSAPPTLDHTPANGLATPYAMQPAAGICATFDEQIVSITINTDMPSPRCTVIRPDQTLRVINATSSTIRVSIGRYSLSILPGDDYSIDASFGEYLAEGVHLISVTPYFGAELWLETGK